MDLLTCFQSGGLLVLIMFLMSLSGEAIMPSGTTAQLDITDNGDGTVMLRLDPTEEGLHHILIKSCATDIPGLTSLYHLLPFAYIRHGAALHGSLLNMLNILHHLYLLCFTVMQLQGNMNALHTFFKKSSKSYRLTESKFPSP